jgi:hypothetical protein
MLDMSVYLRASDAAAAISSDIWEIVIGYTDFSNSLPLTFKKKLIGTMSSSTYDKSMTKLSVEMANR